MTQCKTTHCRYFIRWFRFRNNWRAFDPKELDGRDHAGVAYPVEAKRAWPFTDLVDELMGRLSISRDEAEEHIYAMPWHALHACPPPHEPRKKDT